MFYCCNYTRTDTLCYFDTSAYTLIYFIHLYSVVFVCVLTLRRPNKPEKSIFTVWYLCFYLSKGSGYFTTVTHTHTHTLSRGDQVACETSPDQVSHTLKQSQYSEEPSFLTGLDPRATPETNTHSALQCVCGHCC